MKLNAFTVLTIFILLISCSSNNDDSSNPPPVDPDTTLAITIPFPNLVFNRPVDIQSPDDGTNRLFVVEKGGVIKVFDNSPLSQVFTFLSIISSVNDQGEQGLLGLAFHPDFQTNGYFYIYYNPSSDMSRISRFQLSQGNLNAADPNSEFIILEFFQDALNHNGGQLAFGPDGYLYISSGDGGPSINGQDTSTLTGNILRIDIDNMAQGLNYAIPGSNPFLNNPLILDEIYAYGLRNPWRMSFDPVTGLLWAGDVGAGSKEEIDIIVSGANYGWANYEGTDCRIQPCDPTGITMPVVEYERPANDGAAVTGGYVYRGSLNPQLENKYLYGDSVNGMIWALDINTNENELLYDTELNITCFGVDKDNELFFADYFGGIIYKIDQEEE